ncbi:MULTISPECIES: RICIN domain-containing protein [Halomicrobium]|uniref:RICIN domain-containing protein n=1 Tax=Halomicrobium TaxID=203135 RepID=UPI001CB9201F|nr:MULTISPECIES: RICIN domain-containing protein [Halomicrobium]
MDRRTLTRRGALALMGSGGALLAGQTLGLAKSTANRQTSVDVVSDSDALLGIEGTSGCGGGLSLTNNGQNQFVVEIETDAIDVLHPRTERRRKRVQFPLPPGPDNTVDVEFAPDDGTADEVRISATGQGAEIDLTRRVTTLPLSKGSYQLSPMHSDRRYLGYDWWNDNRVEQLGFPTSWYFTPTGDGCAYTIEHYWRDGVITPENRDSSGSPLVLESPDGTDYQRWNVVPIPNAPDQYRIENEGSGYVIDIEGGETETGLAAIQWPWKGSNPSVKNQFWKIAQV